MSLANAIDAVYDAFADIPKPRSIDACPCCVDQAKICRLLTKPLRQLSSEELSGYASSAFLTAGDIPDYLYFLPRILDLTTADRGWWPSFEVTGRAIAQTSPLTWPAHRLESLYGLVFARLDYAAEQPNNGWLIDEWVCGTARAGIDLAPLLERLEAHPPLLIAYYEKNAKSVAKGSLSNSFWDDSDPGRDIILSWLQAPRTMSIISRHYGL